MEAIVKEAGIRPLEAAKYIGCSDYYIRDMVRRNKIPHYRAGNRILFTKRGLEDWIRYQECLSSIYKENTRTD